MPWTTTRDPGQFLAAAGGFVRSRPVEHNVILSITARLPQAGRPGPGEPPLLGWWAEEPGPQGAFIATAGYPLAVTPMPGQALDELADTLVPPLAGLGAQAGAAWRFARRWQGRTGARVSVHRRQRLYRLGQLVPADPPPPGRARRAADADRGLLHAWHDAFLAELGSTSIRDVPAHVTGRLGYGGLVLWETGGVPVSMAGRTQVMAGICKIAPVYTPPPQRGHGYGTAATAAVTRHAIETGSSEVLLFTDATNPVTNSIYQRLGYHPAEDRLILTFT
jgi:predicted GNAT family acetyltransferase